MASKTIASRQEFQRDPSPAARLVWLAAGCAFGVAAAVAGALQGMGNLLIVYVLQSSRGVHVELWFEQWKGLPLWGLLLAGMAAALGAWIAVLDRVRPDPRRALGIVSAIAALTLGGAWWWAEGGVTWPAVAVGVAWQWALAWRLAVRLSRRALSGSGVEEAERILLASSGFVVGAWALSTLEPVRLPGAAWLEATAVGGMAAAVVCGALYFAGLRRVQIGSELQKAQVRVDARFWRPPPRAFAALVVAAVVFAFVIPSDLVPFHIRDFNRWMEAFTDRIGPWLVPSARIQRESDGLLAQLAGALSRAVSPESGRTGQASPARRIVQALLFVALAAFVWRVLRRKDRPLAPTSPVGRVPMGFRWLLAQVRTAIMRLLARLGWYVRGGPSGWQAAPLADDRQTRPRRRRFRLPDDVILLYLHVIHRLGERGLARRPSETPLEYLDRWRARSRSPDERGLPTLTRLFLAVRYGGEPQRDEMRRGARKAASNALRGWRREVFTARLRALARRNIENDRQGV